ncbi:sce7726 family protein [Corynebacterium durum]|uniref:sce7726 family protein n=1 Tax=Corynebacterium durum TaxID=61592 RepID=UPI0018C8CC8A|nr:sce7726 family protein [Corynebacterium durum]
MASLNFSQRFNKLIDESPIASPPLFDATVGEIFDEAFHILKATGNRDDYVYRTALIQKILLGRHSLNTATLLNETRIGRRKVDLGILNGTSTAYEIKSERDSLNRLLPQLSSYEKVFARVNVVTSENHLKHITELAPKHVGLILLSKRFTLQTIREASEDPNRLDSLSILDVLRTSEAKDVLANLERGIPEVPNTQIRTELAGVFKNLPPKLVHDQMVTTIRINRSQHNLASFVDSVPSSLKAAALTTPLNSDEQTGLREAIATRLEVALSRR